VGRNHEEGRRRWEKCCFDEVPEAVAGLYGGLQIMARHQSKKTSKPASELVKPDIISALPKNADGLVEVLKSTEVLSAPSYQSGYKRSELKLPVDAPLFNATGY